MSTMKVVVLEKSGSHYVVLGSNGSFRQIRNRFNAEVGEEIEIQIEREYLNGLRVWAGIAAMFLMILTALLGWNLYQAPTAVALLSVDINPSLQFVIDAQGNLLEVQTQNEDAKRMLSRIDLRGKPLEEVLEEIITQALNQEFLNAEHRWVVVGYSPMTDKTSRQIPTELNETQIINWVTEAVQTKGFTPQVEVFALTSQDRDSAQKDDLSLGEYALWQTAQKAGVGTQAEKLKDTSERVRLLENPQVQAQIKIDKIDKIDKTDKMGLKSDLKRTPGILEQESGWKGKSNEEGMGKLMPNRSPSSPIKVPNVEHEKGKDQRSEEAKYKQKDQENNLEKEHRQAQNKELDKTKNSWNKDLGRTKNSWNKDLEETKARDNLLAPLPSLGNSRRDTFHIYKIPERQDAEKMNNKNGREENNDDDHNKRG